MKVPINKLASYPNQISDQNRKDVSARRRRQHRLKSIRLYIGLQYLPYMFLFDLPSLQCMIFKCPPNFLIAKKIFINLKRRLLKTKGNDQSQSSKDYRMDRMNNYQKKMFLIRGYNIMSANSKSIVNPVKEMNNNSIKKFFSIQKNKSSFIDKTNVYIDQFKKANQLKIKQWKRLIQLILDLQREGKRKDAELMYSNEVLRGRLPWTRNMFYGIKAFRDKLFNKFVSQDEKQPDK